MRQEELVTDEERRSFEKDGVICLRSVLSPKEIDCLRSAVNCQRDGLGQSSTGYDFEEISRQLWETENQLDTGPACRFDMATFRNAIETDSHARPLRDQAEFTKTGSFLYDVAAWKHDDGVRRVAFDSALPETIAHLLQSKTLNFWEDTTFDKTPGTTQRTAFHQDLAYFQISGEQCVIVWIPLDPADNSNGVMEYVRGSHKWSETYAPNLFVSQTPVQTSPEKRLPDIEANRDQYEIIQYAVEPGDILIHHVRTVHGAGGNLSNKPRRAMSFRYCGDDVRYLDREGAVQQVGVSHDLKDGDVLRSADYPLVYPKPWPGFSLATAYAQQVDRR